MSRIADVIQKSREERARRLEAEAGPEALELRSISEITVPWRLEDARTSARRPSHAPPDRPNPDPPSPSPQPDIPQGLAPSRETIGLTRTLFLAGGASRPRRILVSSVESGVASGPLAVGLALGLARQATGSICLLDLNLSGGTLHSRLGLQAVPGLSDVVFQGMPTEACSQIVPFEPRLSFLAAGSRAQELRTRVRDPYILDAIRASLKAFDFVVGCGEPGDAAEASALGSCFDGVVLVVEDGTRGAEATWETRAALKAAGVRLLGTVLTSCKRPGRA